MDVHPSQQRISCESCRRSKKKCRRTNLDDVQCIRCAYLGASCDSGQQRKVGRPKGKRTASVTTADTTIDPERQRQMTSHNPRVANSSLSGEQTEISQFHLLALGGGSPSQFGVPRSTIPVLEGYAYTWPTFMMDPCYANVPHTGAVVSDKVNLLGDTDATLRASPFLGSWRQNVAVSPLPLVPCLTSPAALHGTPQTWFFAGALNQGVMTVSPTAKRQATYYIHGDKFSHRSGRFMFDIDISNAMAEILRMEHGLQLRRTLINLNRRDINLGMIIYHRGPLYLENKTMAGHVLESSQDLLQILNGLLHNQQRGHDSYSELLSRNIVAAAVSVYCQLLSFYELFLELLTTRLERVSDPPIPIPGFMLNDVPVIGLHAQGAIFCNTSVTLLERFDTLLGTGSDRGKGLLSERQIGLLWNALDGGVGLTASDGIMRPADLQKLYAQVRGVLEQVQFAPH